MIGGGGFVANVRALDASTFVVTAPRRDYDLIRPQQERRRNRQVEGLRRHAGKQANVVIVLSPPCCSRSALSRSTRSE